MYSTLFSVAIESFPFLLHPKGNYSLSSWFLINVIILLSLEFVSRLKVTLLIVVRLDCMLPKR